MARRACSTGEATPGNPIVLVLVLLGLLVSGLFTGGWPAAARAADGPGAGWRAAPVAVAARPSATVKAGTNLLLNPQATVGESAQVWDAVTIPGWQVQAGLPTVVRYGTSGFPKAAGTWPASRGDLFAGGAGGTASLVQVVRFGSVPAGTRFTAGAWLGGTKTSDAELQVRFLDADGRVKSTATIGPVGRQTRPVLAYRTATGTIPAGAIQARVTLVLATTLTDYNGPDAPEVGNSYATAAGLRLAVSRPVARPAALTPPRPHVPRYQHVFLFYFENEDVKDIIGNTKQAPYFNSLLKQGTSLTSFYAEEHPSDANYVAFAAGATDGLPPTDPEEENPLYTINAPNIGDLVDARGESWKAYTQSADGPCDDTVHSYYWNDDQPMLYFKDVRDNPAYCASHVVPLEELPGDLRSAATTPNFAWVSPDDCTDMEGCGIAAGDAFLKTELSQIMNSPAWRTQRSLAIITFDEDAQDGQHPAQRIPTIVLGSQGVKRGATDATRYTHYSMLRTVEAALGTGTLTANDRYAPAFNHVFDTEQAVTRAAPVPAPRLRAGGPARSRRGSRHGGRADGCAGRGRAVPRVRCRGPPAGRLGGRLRRQHRHPGEPRHPQGGPGDPGRPRPAGDRRRAERQDRLRRRQRVRHRHPDQRGHRKARPAGPGRPRPLGPGGHAQRQDLVRGRQRLGHGHPGGDRVRGGPGGKGGDADPGRPRSRAIALTPDGATAYVLNWLSGTVTPIATATGRPAPRSASAPSRSPSPSRPERARSTSPASAGTRSPRSAPRPTAPPARARPATLRTRWRRPAAACSRSTGTPTR